MHNFYYTTAWGLGRRSFYTAISIPVVWTDGLIKMLGSSGEWEEDYLELEQDLLTRLAVPTDVTITLSAEEVAEATYLITATVGLDADGVAKTVRVHIVDTLFDYPPGYTDGRYNNCVRQGFDMGEFPLVPGQTIDIQQQITFRAESWDNRENIRIMAFAQDPADSAPAEVHQAEIMYWPLVPECPEDLNADGKVNIDDLFMILGAWGTCDTCPEDLNDDGKVNIDDLFLILGGWGPCQ
ncbi:MAG: hypothetical protein JSV91_16145 [Phycisphaerales bacterium]|nr:MAG: hypothetical protein JSV91_16145 [Phycisphaerales bacterium]